MCEHTLLMPPPPLPKEILILASKAAQVCRKILRTPSLALVTDFCTIPAVGSGGLLSRKMPRPRSTFSGLLIRSVDRVATCVLLESMVKPRDERDASKDLARDLADIAGQLASLKGEAKAWLRDSNYKTLKLRLENAHSAIEAAVEARMRVRLNGER